MSSGDREMISFLLQFLEYGVALASLGALLFVFIRIPAPAWIAVVVTAVVALGLHSLSINRIERTQEKALADLQIKIEERCEAEKKLTEGIAHDLQSKVSDLNSRVANLKRLRPSNCVPITPDAARVRNEKTGDAGLPRSNGGALGIESDALFDFARDAEEVGLQLDACQDFIEKAWALNR